MGIFTPGMFGRMFGRREAPKEDDTPVTPPIVCDVCHREGHARETCPSIVTEETLWKTWLSSGTRDRSLRDGDTFDLISDFYARFRGE